MTNTINKLVFDFTCSSEMLARKVQKEIVHYVAPRLEHLLNNYLETHAIEDGIIEIKNIEIDLGNILLDDFKDDEILKQVIEEINKKLNYNIKNQVPESSSITKSELQIIKSFLLFGDVPWWVDKTQRIDFNTILKHQFELNFTDLKDFFESYQNDSFFRNRLKENFNKSSLKLVDKYIFFNQKNALKSQKNDLLREKKNNFSQSYLLSQHESHDSLQNRIKDKNKQTQNQVDDEILKDSDFKIIENVENNELERNEFQLIQAGEFHILSSSNNKIPAVENEILKAKNQEIPQVSRGELIEILTFSKRKKQNISTLKSEEVKKVLEVENEKKLPIDNRHFSHIFEQLLEENFSLLQSILEEYLFFNVPNKNPKQHLVNKKYFKSSPSKNADFEAFKINELLESIINHSYFFKYNLWEIISEISFENFAERIDFQQFKENKSATFAKLKAFKNGFAEKAKKVNFISRIYQNSLPLNDHFQAEIEVFEPTFSEKLNSSTVENNSDESIENAAIEVLFSIFKKKKIETILESNLVKKLLQIIPKEILPVIYFFTQIKEEKIALFLPENTPLIQSKNVSLIQNEKYDSEEVERIKSIFKNTDGERKIIIENAGICIVSAYLPTFWKNLGYTKDKDFKTVQDGCNAIGLIQYLSTGEKKSKEYLWQFNKLLCGFDIDDFISVKHTISVNDFEEADELLEAVVGNWNTLKNTSIEGLRTSFLQRKGILTEKDDHWLLQIERKGFDLLLDSIPWGFSTIKMPWMKKYIQVEW